MKVKHKLTTRSRIGSDLARTDRSIPFMWAPALIANLFLPHMALSNRLYLRQMQYLHLYFICSLSFTFLECYISTYISPIIFPFTCNFTICILCFALKKNYTTFFLGFLVSVESVKLENSSKQFNAKLY